MLNISLTSPNNGSADTIDRTSRGIDANSNSCKCRTLRLKFGIGFVNLFKLRATATVDNETPLSNNFLKHVQNFEEDTKQLINTNLSIHTRDASTIILKFFESILEF